jgi:hypothetical protein
LLPTWLPERGTRRPARTVTQRPAGRWERRLRSSLVTASIALSVLGVAASSTIAGGEAAKSPRAILSDMKRDLSKVESLHWRASGVTRA